MGTFSIHRGQGTTKGAVKNPDLGLGELQAGTLEPPHP